MTHPTDDELEIRAITLNEIARVRRSGNVLERELADMLDRTAAALRACKDQDTWNAAIEAAATVVDAQSDDWRAKPEYMTLAPVYEAAGRKNAAVIRALKRGPRHD